MTEDDLNYYYAQIELLWLTGFRTTFERIWDHLPPTERHVAHLTAGLATLVERKWLKLHEMPVSGPSDEIIYETCYVPIRTTRR